MEWNSGAIGVIFFLFLIPVALIYLVIRKLIKGNPVLSLPMDKLKIERFYLYVFVQIGLVVLSITVAYGILSLMHSITGKGLLE